MTKSKEENAKDASYVTRAFGHYMDIGGTRAGTWIISTLNVADCPSDEDLKKLAEERILSMSRFKSVLKVTKSTAKFVEVDEIEWDYHLTRVFEGEKPTEDDMLDFLQDIFTYGLDKDKPLWRFIVFPEMEDGSCNLVMVFNHAIADGIAAIGVLLKIIDDSPIDPTIPMHKQKKTDDTAIVQKRKKGPSVSTWTKISMFFTGLGKGLFSPLDSEDKDNTFRLKADIDVNDETKYTGRKHFGRAEDISLDEIKEMKSRFAGATVNDVLLAVMTIALKNFLKEVEDPVLKDKNGLRGNFPVSMRGKNEPLLKDNNPCNNWQPYAFRFPMDYESPVDCVWKVKDIVDRNKVSPELPVQNSLGKVLLNTLPRSVVLPTFLKMGTKASMMLSNVPGPQRTVHIAGQAVNNMSFYLVAPIGTYLGVLSYAGSVRMTVNFDESLGVDPKDFVKHWGTAFEELKEDMNNFEDLIPRSRGERKKVRKVKENKE